MAHHRCTDPNDEIALILRAASRMRIDLDSVVRSADRVGPEHQRALVGQLPR